VDMNQDVLQAALAEAITKAVTPDMRNEVFVTAVREFLFRTDRSRQGPAPLTEAFDRALRDVVVNVAEEMLKEPETYNRVREFYRAAIDKTLSDPNVAETLTRKIIHALRYG
jgi:hypothetical protein